MTSMRALCARIASERRIGAAYWVISAERTRSFGNWRGTTSVTWPPETTILTWMSPNRVGTTAHVNVPFATRLAGVCVCVGVGVAGAVAASGLGAGGAGVAVGAAATSLGCGVTLKV